jgi:hypothetical protein
MDQQQQQQQQNNGSWFRHLFSLDELKVSILSLSLIGILILDAYMALKYHDVPTQLGTITVVLVGAIAGFNAVSVVAGNMAMNRTNQPMQMPMQNSMYGGYGINNMYGSSYPINPTIGTTMPTQTVTQVTTSQSMPKM